LYLCEGGVGIKTGYTREAGRCLVSAATRDHMTLVCTLLNCPTTYEGTIALFNDAFSAYERVCLVKKGQEFILQTKDSTIKSYANDNFYYPLLKEEKDLITIKSKWIENREKSKKNSGKIGEFQIYLAKRLLFSGNLYKL
jgi:D-alanyl-D-alanine carboxypeptidase